MVSLTRTGLGFTIKDSHRGAAEKKGPRNPSIPYIHLVHQFKVQLSTIITHDPEHAFSPNYCRSNPWGNLQISLAWLLGFAFNFQ